MLPIRQPLHDLPPPSAEAQTHSERLRTLIRAEIETAAGGISFERYMELALYAPGLGYYSAGARKFGAAGDFVTAPEVSPLFARCLARQCAEVLTALGSGCILELGAGSGVMAADLLAELERFGRPPERYLILEVSAELRERQQALLATHMPQWRDRITWLERLPQAFRGVILGNEVLDALPVERFRRGAKGFEQFVVVENGDGFAWDTRSAPAPLQRMLAALEASLPGGFLPGYISEICPRLPAFVASLGDTLAHGALLLLDYGYPRAGYYHADRAMGTLLCHYRQHAHDDPFRFAGLQDITAHVDFTATAEAALTAGLELVGYTTQAHFLLALGIAAEAGDWQQAREVKLLTLPQEMGERFKAIAFTRALGVPLQGFALRDLAHTL